MAKRGADQQLTQDNSASRHDDDDAPTTTSFASSETMAKRKILKPRGKTFAFSTPPTTQPASFPAATLGSVGSSLNDKSNDKALKIKALNIKFVESLSASNSGDKAADFRPLVKKYLEYYEKIEGGAIGESTAESKPLFTSATPLKFDSSKPQAVQPSNAAPSDGPVNPFGGIFGAPKPQAAPVETAKETQKSEAEDSDSEDDDKPVKVEGPTFTMTSKPTAKKLPFSFGPKPVKKPSSDSDSESDIEIKGPSFTFNKKILDPVFKLAETKKAEESVLTEASTPAPVFGQAAKKEEEQPKQAFSASAFSFGAPKASEQASFGSTPSTSGFSFGSTEKAPTSAFSFGKPATETAKPVSDPKPAFLFGAPKQDEGAPKPTFSFGMNTDNKLFPSFNAAPALTFSFGKKADETPAAKPFSFGQKAVETADTKPFSFGSSQPTFGAASATGSQGESKPLFQFNSSASTGTFGSNAAAAKPVDSVTEEVVEEEETGGNFEPVAKLGAKVDTQATGEENEEVLYQRKAKLMLFDAEKKDSPYTNLGVGELKVLASKSNSSSRILMRADGGLRILLNVALLKDVSYANMGNGSLVRVPTVSSEGKIETYVIKVKTPADGEELCNLLNKSKA